MRLEYGIILNLCRYDNIKIDIDEDTLSGMSWDDILWQIATHRIECLLTNKKINNNPLGKYNKVIGRDIESKYLFYNYRNRFLYERVLPELIEILENTADGYAFTKGIITASALYDDVGYRTFGDIDILVNKKDLRNIKKALYSKGYILGEYDVEKNIINEASPQMIKFYEMTTHQTSPVCKIFDNSISKCVELDINFGLGPDKHLKDSEFISAVLSRRIKYQYNGTEFWGLSWEDLLLHNCFQIYRDSAVTFHIKENDDIKLYQYVELYRMIKQWRLDWDYIITASIEKGFQSEVYYALHHCTILFDDIKADVYKYMEKIEPENKQYLDEFGVENKERGIWDISFIERVFKKNRFQAIKDIVENRGFEEFKKREQFMEKND